MYENNLEELGLSKNEAEIYTTLLREGPVQAGIISKKTKLNRTTIYQVLEKLIDKGLASHINKGKVKVFQASSPERLITLQEEKKELAKEILPRLNKISNPSKEDVTVYRGRKGIKTIMREILECKEYISFGSSGEFLDFMKHDFYLYQKEKQKRKIKSKVLIGESKRENDIVTKAHAEFRFMSDKYMTPTTIWVYGEKTAIIIWSFEPIVTLIKSKKLSRAYISYFKILWEIAKK